MEPQQIWCPFCSAKTLHAHEPSIQRFANGKWRCARCKYARAISAPELGGKYPKEPVPRIAPEMAQEIARILDARELSQKAVARKFGVSVHVVRSIRYKGNHTRRE